MILLSLAGASFAPAATAQVLQIGDGGAVTTFDRPTVFQDDGATSIPRPGPRVRSPADRPAAATDQAPLLRAAQSSGLSPDLLEAVARQESGLRPAVVSRAGAIGEMQLMPATARDLGVDPWNSEQNLEGGARYLSSLLRRYDGDLVRALAAYNAGAGAVDRYGGVPPYRETRSYVAAVLARLSRRAAAAPNP